MRLLPEVCGPGLTSLNFPPGSLQSEHNIARARREVIKEVSDDV